MKKKTMIHVNTVRSAVHIPVDPGDTASLGKAAEHIKALRVYLEAIGFGVVVEPFVHRVPLPPPLPPPEASEPEPEPNPAVLEAPDAAEPPDGQDAYLQEIADDLDIPESLRRTAESKTAE